MTTQYQEKYSEESRRIYSNPEYRFRDKAAIFLWECIGRFTPVITMKYAMTGLSDRGMIYESLAWVGSVALNFAPMLFKGAPLHIYGGYAGLHIGELRAEVSIGRKKQTESPLETMSKENILQNTLPTDENKQAA